MRARSMILFRILPREELCELVCADEEERIVILLFLQQVDGAVSWGSKLHLGNRGTRHARASRATRRRAGPLGFTATRIASSSRSKRRQAASA